jgi:hypothetical protein
LGKNVDKQDNPRYMPLHIAFDASGKTFVVHSSDIDLDVVGDLSP